MAVQENTNTRLHSFPIKKILEKFPHTIFIHIVKEFFLFFLAAFFFFVSLFLINQLVVIARDQLSDQISLSDALLLVFYAMPTFVALSFPFGSFLGVLLSISKLSHDREIMAAQASGFSLTYLLIPIFIISLGLSSLSFFVNDYLLPLGNLRYIQVFEQLAYSNSQLLLEPYSARQYQDVNLITGNVVNNVIEQLLITDNGENGDQRVISAKEARLVQNDAEGGIISLELSDVVIHDVKTQNTSDYTISYASKLVYNILLRNITVNLRNPSPREMSAGDVFKLIGEQSKRLRFLLSQKERRLINSEIAGRDSFFWTLTNEGTNSFLERSNKVLEYNLQYSEIESTPVFDRTLQTQKIEYYKKFAIPLGCISLLILGFPLALLSEQHGRFFGILIGLVCSAAYWFLLVGAEAFALRNPWVEPFIPIMLPNILAILAGSTALMLRIRR